MFAYGSKKLAKISVKEVELLEVNSLLVGMSLHKIDQVDFKI